MFSAGAGTNTGQNTLMKKTASYLFSGGFRGNGTDGGYPEEQGLKPTVNQHECVECNTDGDHPGEQGLKQKLAALKKQDIIRLMEIIQDWGAVSKTSRRDRGRADDLCGFEFKRSRRPSEAPGRQYPGRLNVSDRPFVRPVQEGTRRVGAQAPGVRDYSRPPQVQPVGVPACLDRRVAGG